VYFTCTFAIEAHWASIHSGAHTVVVNTEAAVLYYNYLCFWSSSIPFMQWRIVCHPLCLSIQSMIPSTWGQLLGYSERRTTHSWGWPWCSKPRSL